MTAENLIKAAMKRRISNGWVHKHHEGCIHNLSPEEQIDLLGHTIEWWTRVIGPMPIQITPNDWEEPPIEIEGVPNDAE